MTEARAAIREPGGARLEARDSPAVAVQPRRRVALVHDWLTGMRGGEKVLEAIAALHPSAPIYALHHVKGSVSPALERRRIITSFVQHLPGRAVHYRQYLPLFPTAVEQFNLDGYDLVISTSHCAVKSVVVPGRAWHICYCHSPMRYAWDQFDAYFGPDQVGRARSAVLRPVLARLARWDAATAARVDRFVANSQYVAGRISRYYNRRSAVVHPPVDTEFYGLDPARRPEGYFLAVSALVPYKRLETAIEACGRVGMPLKVVGRGPELPRLQAMAGSRAEFLGWRTDEEIRHLYQSCQAVLMPGTEDFGMVPVEAQACGRPVVALAAGGALETVRDGLTGVLVSEPTVDAFVAGLQRALSVDWDPGAIRNHAEGFSVSRFQQQFRAIVEDVTRQPRSDSSTGSGSSRATSSDEATQ